MFGNRSREKRIPEGEGGGEGEKGRGVDGDDDHGKFGTRVVHHSNCEMIVLRMLGLQKQVQTKRTNAAGP